MIPLRFPLTARQQNLLLGGLTALLVASIAIALANLSWLSGGHANTGAVVAPAPTRLSTAPVDLGPAQKLQPFGAAAPGQDVQPTALPLQLRGIIGPTAFIATGAEPARAYRVGEQLSGVTLDSIGRDRVFLRNAGRVEYLAFRDPFAAPPAAPGSTPMQPGAAPVPSIPALPTAPIVPTVSSPPPGLVPPAPTTAR